MATKGRKEHIEKEKNLSLRSLCSFVAKSFWRLSLAHLAEVKGAKTQDLLQCNSGKPFILEKIVAGE